MTGCDFIYMNLAYLIQEPIYQCKFAGSEEWQTCTEADFCGNMIDQPDAEWKVDWDDRRSIHNWRERLNLTCASKFRIDLLLWAWFIGIAITTLWVPRMADKSSRKQFIGFAVIFDFVMYSTLLFAESYALMVFVLLCLGLTNPIRVQIGWVYLLELVSVEYQPMVGTIYAVFDASIAFTSTIFIWFSQEWQGIIVLGYMV